MLIVKNLSVSSIVLPEEDSTWNCLRFLYRHADTLPHYTLHPYLPNIYFRLMPLVVPFGLLGFAQAQFRLGAYPRSRRNRVTLFYLNLDFKK